MPNGSVRIGRGSVRLALKRSLQDMDDHEDTGGNEGVDDNEIASNDGGLNDHITLATLSGRNSNLPVGKATVASVKKPIPSSSKQNTPVSGKKRQRDSESSTAGLSLSSQNKKKRPSRSSKDSVTNEEATSRMCKASASLRSDSSVRKSVAAKTARRGHRLSVSDAATQDMPPALTTTSDLSQTDSYDPLTRDVLDSAEGRTGDLRSSVIKVVARDIPLITQDIRGDLPIPDSDVVMNDTPVAVSEDLDQLQIPNSERAMQVVSSQAAYEASPTTHLEMSSPADTFPTWTHFLQSNEDHTWSLGLVPLANRTLVGAPKTSLPVLDHSTLIGNIASITSPPASDESPGCYRSSRAGRRLERSCVLIPKTDTVASVDFEDAQASSSDLSSPGEVFAPQTSIHTFSAPRKTRHTLTLKPAAQPASPQKNLSTNMPKKRKSTRLENVADLQLIKVQVKRPRKSNHGDASSKSDKTAHTPSKSSKQTAKSSVREVPISPISLGHTSQSNFDNASSVTRHKALTVADWDRELLEISASILNSTSLEQKPLPRGEPAVWADDRQSLCETLSWYQSRQSAAYSNGGTTSSYFLSNNGSERDIMDDNIIVFRAGGGMMKDDTGTKYVQKTDHEETAAQVRSFKNTMAQQNPVIVLSGDKNSSAPSKMPHEFNVRDRHKPTDFWTERLWSPGNKNHPPSRKKLGKYRLERLKDDERPWYVPEGDYHSVELGSLGPPVSSTCMMCKRESQQVYLEAWMCLQGECEANWKLADGIYPDEKDLHYDPRWLKKKTEWAVNEPPFNFRPLLLQSTGRVGEDVTSGHIRGMCCPKCGKCNKRMYWKGWACTGCGYEHYLSHLAIPLDVVKNFHRPTPSGIPITYNVVRDPSVTVTTTISDGCKVLKYEVPGLEGEYIVHIIVNKAQNEAAWGADAMWDELQKTDIGLQRRGMQKGDLMQSYMVNFGEHYKFIASVESKPFEGSPWPVRATWTKLIKWAKKLFPEIEDKDQFNELLAVGYLEKLKMGFHDDGEFGLGPTVASISLGAEGSMAWKIKDNVYSGVMKGGENACLLPPIPGCLNWEARKTALERLMAKANGKPSQAQIKELGRDHGVKKAGRGPVLLEAVLSHGDIMIMHGSRIQKYLEHNAHNRGAVRIALTCRTITDAHLPEHEKTGYQVGADTGFVGDEAVRDENAAETEIA